MLLSHEGSIDLVNEWAIELTYLAKFSENNAPPNIQLLAVFNSAQNKLIIESEASDAALPSIIDFCDNNSIDSLQNELSRNNELQCLGGMLWWKNLSFSA